MGNARIAAGRRHRRGRSRDSPPRRPAGLASDHEDRPHRAPWPDPSPGGPRHARSTWRPPPSTTGTALARPSFGGSGSRRTAPEASRPCLGRRHVAPRRSVDAQLRSRPRIAPRPRSGPSTPGPTAVPRRRQRQTPPRAARWSRGSHRRRSGSRRPLRHPGAPAPARTHGRTPMPRGRKRHDLSSATYRPTERERRSRPTRANPNPRSPRAERDRCGRPPAPLPPTSANGSLVVPDPSAVIAPDGPTSSVPCFRTYVRPLERIALHGGTPASRRTLESGQLSAFVQVRAGSLPLPGSAGSTCGGRYRGTLVRTAPMGCGPVASTPVRHGSTRRGSTWAAGDVRRPASGDGAIAHARWPPGQNPTPRGRGERTTSAAVAHDECPGLTLLAPHDAPRALRPAVRGHAAAHRARPRARSGGQPAHRSVHRQPRAGRSERPHHPASRRRDRRHFRLADRVEGSLAQRHPGAKRLHRDRGGHPRGGARLWPRPRSSPLTWATG
jgi:hypothetical protein